MSGSAGKFLDTRGNTTLGIGVCDRCSTKRPLTELMSDGNASGLKVCKDPAEGCMDKYDPYRMSTRVPDPITLPFYRPDQPLEELPYDTADLWLRDDAPSASLFVLVVTEDGRAMTTEGGIPIVMGLGGLDGE